MLGSAGGGDDCLGDLHKSLGSVNAKFQNNYRTSKREAPLVSVGRYMRAFADTQPLHTVDGPGNKLSIRYADLRVLLPADAQDLLLLRPESGLVGKNPAVPGQSGVSDGTDDLLVFVHGTRQGEE